MDSSGYFYFNNVVERLDEKEYSSSARAFDNYPSYPLLKGRKDALTSVRTDYPLRSQRKLREFWYSVKEY